MRKILSCIFSILLCSGGLAAQDTSGAVTADTTTVSEAKKPRRVDTIPLERRGLRVGLDVLQPILSFVNNQPQGAEILLVFEVKTNYLGVLVDGLQQMEMDGIRYNYNTRGKFGGPGPVRCRHGGYNNCQVGKKTTPGGYHPVGAELPSRGHRCA